MRNFSTSWVFSWLFGRWFSFLFHLKLLFSFYAVKVISYVGINFLNSLRVINNISTMYYFIRIFVTSSLQLKGNLFVYDLFTVVVFSWLNWNKIISSSPVMHEKQHYFFNVLHLYSFNMENAGLAKSSFGSNFTEIYFLYVQRIWFDV